MSAPTCKIFVSWWHPAPYELRKNNAQLHAITSGLSHSGFCCISLDVNVLSVVQENIKMKSIMLLITVVFGQCSTCMFLTSMFVVYSYLFSTPLNFLLLMSFLLHSPILERCCYEQWTFGSNVKILNCSVKFSCLKVPSNFIS